MTVNHRKTKKVILFHIIANYPDDYSKHLNRFFYKCDSSHDSPSTCFNADLIRYTFLSCQKLNFQVRSVGICS